MAKAEKGDLIRIVEISDVNERIGCVQNYEVGGIYEVVETYEVGEKDDEEALALIAEGDYLYDSEYEIFRKAGEEDSPNILDVVYAECKAEADAQLDGMTQENRIRSACSELAELLVRKNHDYGDSFAQQYGKYGLMSALIRMDDKMRRLETLQQAESKAQVDESVSDTLLDLAGYALLSYVEQSKTK